METTRIDGNALAKKIDKELLAKFQSVSPGLSLAIVLVGSNKLSEIFVGKKKILAEKLGVKCDVIHISGEISTSQLRSRISKIQKTDSYNGFIVQLPLPEHISEDRILKAIKHELDLELVTKRRVGELAAGSSAIVPPVTQAVLWVIEEYDITVESRNVLVIGNGLLVGRPTSQVLSQMGATVTVANSKTKNLSDLCKNADIIVSGTGRKNLFSPDDVKEGVVIIDAGTQVESQGKKVEGDVEYRSFEGIAQYITPTPGGIGPLTVRAIFHNLYIMNS